MMLKRVTLATAAILATSATAQYVTSEPTDGVLYAVSIPDSTASSGQGTIYLRLVAPSGTSWLGLGQGSSMSGSNIFMMYAAGNNNVTVSPRLGTGQRQPSYNSGASISVLEGSGIQSDGSMVANIRCDSCNSWSGGSMNPTDSGSSWIWAIKTGSAIDSTDLSESLLQHSTEGNINFDLTQATSPSNPFVVSSGGGSSSSSAAGGSASSTSAGSPSSTGSSAPTATSAATVTGGLLPQPTSSGSSSPASGSSSSSSSSGGSSDGTRKGHAIIMSLLFLVFFPMFALTLYLPFAKKVPFVHAPLQILSIILLIVGLALGVRLGKKVNELDGYHQVIGYIVVFCLIIFQPALGIYQHMHYRRTGGRSALGTFHQWLGRSVILLGVVNGGLGFKQSGPVGSENVPRGGVITYSIVAVIAFLIYLTVVFLAKRRQQAGGAGVEKPYGGGYEMNSGVSSNPAQLNYRSQNHKQEYARRFPGVEGGRTV